MGMRPIGIAVGIALAVVTGAVAKEPAGTVEMTGPSTAFEQADKNKNGALDHAEYYDREVDVFYLIDTDKDGKLTMTELGEVDRDAFVRADRDKNGTLSIDEFTAARFKDFEGADANGDEVLTATEIE